MTIHSEYQLNKARDILQFRDIKQELPNPTHKRCQSQIWQPITDNRQPMRSASLLRLNLSPQKCVRKRKIWGVSSTIRRTTHVSNSGNWTTHTSRTRIASIPASAYLMRGASVPPKNRNAISITDRCNSSDKLWNFTPTHLRFLNLVPALIVKPVITYTLTKWRGYNPRQRW